MPSSVFMESRLYWLSIASRAVMSCRAPLYVYEATVASSWPSVSSAEPGADDAPPKPPRPMK